MTELTIAQALAMAGDLKTVSSEPQVDIEHLLCFVLKQPRSYCFTWPEKTLSCEQQTAFLALLDARKAGQPVAHLLGERGFWKFDLEVSNATLIPRADTELLVEKILQHHAKEQSNQVLDLGSGTGAIALALAYERPHWQVLGVDVVPEAVALARRNQLRVGVNNIQFLESDWFSAISEATRYNIIVSNPPYIDALDPHLQQGDVRFEPKSALVAAQNGMAAINHIAQLSTCYLKPGGYLYFEHGFQQAEVVRLLLTKLGYTHVQSAFDFGGQERITWGIWPSS
ncbi:peptide chain release factor N(5)-glutamine methyltransferase [Zooshikella ganghwensis]|uniref:Release factor glutamine methyltransferase n=1 Tax=Zooshikella ganghwensis TaxID=202772 RepID=A0A4P9VT99_9GAMM|nr:peptide chain release factor N(5)-glutamine methyltransferase [Zooshikella ganghwensis]RDH45654.1 peptide chain release factor N(5)-glutamine methyltransferase [Zooshikella ganghwensis]